MRRCATSSSICIACSIPSPSLEASPLKRLLRNDWRARWVQRAVGYNRGRISAARVFDNRLQLDPPDIYERPERELPVIIAIWHGQHFLAPFIKTKASKAKVLISRHRDGEMNAVAAERLGVETIRGSGDHGDGFNRKGGVGAFSRWCRRLRRATTWHRLPTCQRYRAWRGRDHQAGAGIRPPDHAGRNGSTRRSRGLNNWDRTTINLPFGRGAVVGVDAIRSCRRKPMRDHGKAAGSHLETDLNSATAAPMRLSGEPEAGMAERLPMTLRAYRHAVSGDAACFALAETPPEAAAKNGRPDRRATRHDRRAGPKVRWSGCTAQASAKCCGLSP